jgi:hypothetical protein
MIQSLSIVVLIGGYNEAVGILTEMPAYLSKIWIGKS